MTNRFVTSLVVSTIATVGWIATSCGGRTPLLLGSDNSGYPAPSTSQPASDGGCPDGFTICGKRGAARCYDLTRSPDHCGACANTCAPGIDCQSSKCQQYECKGALSFEALPLVCPKCTGAYEPVLGDFNRDGHLDFVGPTGDAGGMGLLLGQGDGTFAPYPVVASYASPWNAAAADLNGDGWLDLVTVAGGESAISVRLGNEDDYFTPATTYSTQSPVLGLLLTDLDDDGNVDLAAAQDKRLSIWRGSASGSLGEPVDRTVGVAGSFLASADWNQDGVPDLLYGSSTLRMMLGRGDGTFDSETACGIAVADNLPIPTTSGTVLADFDHDQKVDMVAGSKVVLLGMKGCNYTTLVDLPAHNSGASGSVGVADLNGDGHADIVAAFFAVDRKLQVILGDGRGGFAAPTILSDAEVNNAAVYLTGDLNHDKKLDVIATSSGGWRVFLNTCP